MNDRIESLRRAVEASPDDPALRVLLGETLAQAGRVAEALQEFETLLARGQLSGDAALWAGNLAVDAERVDLAKGFLEAARAAGVVEGVAALQARVDGLLAQRAPMVRAGGEPEDPGSPWDQEVASTTFDQVGGLEDVKKAINRAIILPFSRPELYERYGRKSGGGILLYGPPGCGKTLLARATAGECGVPFVNVRIEQVLDPFLGMSERNLHSAFEHARASAPCVLFLDEIDGLGFARSRHASASTRTLVDLLLQELDSIGAENDDVLILAATNAPWDVDEALLRPGRFDRRIFVPPPDEEARRHIFGIMTASIPNRAVDVGALAKRTPLYSGADIRALLNRAVDAVIDEALEGGAEPPLEGRHLDAAMPDIHPTTLEWLERARHYVEFANQGGRYSEIEAFLKRRDVQKLLGKR